MKKHILSILSSVIFYTFTGVNTVHAYDSTLAILAGVRRS